MGYRLVACVLSLSLSFAYGSESSVSYELPISDYTGGLEGLPLQERLWISGNWDCGRTQGQIRFEKNSSDSYQVTFSALEWPRTVCTAHVQISLLVEANRVLQTQFSLQSPTLEKLIEQFKEHVDSLAVFYVPATSVPYFYAPTANEGWDLTYSFGSKTYRVASDFGTDSIRPSAYKVRNTYHNGRQYLPELFWVSKRPENVGENAPIRVAATLHKSPQEERIVNCIQELYNLWKHGPE